MKIVAERTVYNFISEQDQTTFAIAYTLGSNVDVYLNGVHLTSSEYTLSGGDSIIFNDPLDAGENLDVIVYRNAVVGSQGIQGIQGDLGIQGIQGDFGPQGIQGIQGSQGT